MEKTYYDELIDKDWVHVFEDEMDAGRIKFDKNGHFHSRQIVTKGNPWIFNKCLSLEYSI